MITDTAITNGREQPNTHYLNELRIWEAEDEPVSADWLPPASAAAVEAHETVTDLARTRGQACITDAADTWDPWTEVGQPFVAIGLRGCDEAAPVALMVRQAPG